MSPHLLWPTNLLNQILSFGAAFPWFGQHVKHLSESGWAWRYTFPCSCVLCVAFSVYPTYRISQEVDQHKLQSYGAGTQRKSKYQRDKEAADLRRKQEEQDAAKAYAEFIDAFDAGPSTAADSSEPVRSRYRPSQFIREDGSFLSSLYLLQFLLVYILI